jgi:hypothetical protein
MYTLDQLKSKDFGEWDFYPRSDKAIGEFCCDGDGIVAVIVGADGFIRLYDQGTYVRRLKSDIDAAMVQATRYVKTHYAGIYEEYLA